MAQHHAAGDATSDYEETLASEFTSVKTATLLNLYENGRRYQAIIHDRYGLPNDNDEQVREWVKHKMFIDYLNVGNLLRSPIGEHPQKIVDLGTGVGFWAIDVAERYPSARIIGTDISAIQPCMTPPNLEFRMEDIEDQRPWTRIYQDADLIHMRCLLQTLRNPREVIARAYQNLKPGAWIECQETTCQVRSADGTPLENHPLNRLYSVVDTAFARIYGWDVYITLNLPSLLREAGFVNVSEHRYPVPLSHRQKKTQLREAALFHQSVTIDFVSAVLTKYEVMGLSEEAATQLWQDVYDSFDDPDAMAVVNWVDVWAQKPL